MIDNTAKKVASLLRYPPTKYGYTFCVICGKVTQRLYACEMKEDGRNCYDAASEERRQEINVSVPPKRFNYMGELGYGTQ